MSGLTVRGDVDPRAVEQLKRCMAAGNAAAGALCADGHVGYSQPIGGVVAYRGQISPSGVGYDIGCGNKAVRTNLGVRDIARSLPAVMDDIQQRVSFGMGRVNDEPVDHPVLDAIANADFVPQRGLAELARKQLGTVGAGNHYVDLFSDEEGWLWIGVHFGSRGFGHKTASGFLALAQGLSFGEKANEGEMDSPPILFGTDTDLGQSYLAAMTLAGEYAYAGRDVVVEKVLEILGARAVEEVHNHHNFAWRETHGRSVCEECDGSGEVFFGEVEIDTYFEGMRACPECAGEGRVGGEDVWVVRKGATPAWPGQRGFVGATMGEPSVILEGIEAPAADALLHSTVHGAGRVMSRTAAAGRSRRRWTCNNRECDWCQTKGAHKPADGLCPLCGARVSKQWIQISAGKIDWPAVLESQRELGIELRGGAADEAPLAYKRLDDVLAAHADTIRVLHTLTPIGVAMAGADLFDPYKD